MSDYYYPHLHIRKLGFKEINLPTLIVSGEVRLSVLTTVFYFLSTKEVFLR